jgi:tyrosyl-tRNA synthetase
VKAAAAALFGGGELREIEPATLAAALTEAPHVDVAQSAELPTYAELFATSGLVASKGAARRAVAEGGVYVNNVRVENSDARPTADDLLPGGWLLLRRGKKNLAGARVV